MISSIDGLRWQLRDDTSDWNTVAACSKFDEYGLKDLDVLYALVFDIGAHIGGVAVSLAARGARVIAIEPVPDNAFLIRKNALLNDVSVTVLNAAVGATRIRYGFDGDENARHHAWIGNTDQVYQTAPGATGFLESEVTCVTLAALIREYGLPDIVKLDCEGGEWAILAEEATKLLPYIVGEWHPTQGHVQEELRDLLLPTHELTITGPVGGPGGFKAVLR